jgi:hypothetical protein
MARSRTARVGWCGVLVACALLLQTGRASAVGAPKERPAGEPATARVLQIGLGGEYGVKLAGPALNPWAFGLGVSLGYTLPAGVYVGLPFDYFFGSREERGALPLEEKLWHFGAEGGYDLALASELVLRLKAGIGVAANSYERCDGDLCVSSTDLAPAFGPGLTFLYLGPSFSFTVDGRYQLVPLDPLAQGLIFSVGFGF